jgi:hypothetical protein
MEPHLATSQEYEVFNTFPDEKEVYHPSKLKSIELWVKYLVIVC